MENYPRMYKKYDVTSLIHSTIYLDTLLLITLVHRKHSRLKTETLKHEALKLHIWVTGDLRLYKQHDYALGKYTLVVFYLTNVQVKLSIVLKCDPNIFVLVSA